MKIKNTIITLLTTSIISSITGTALAFTSDDIVAKPKNYQLNVKPKVVKIFEKVNYVPNPASWKHIKSFDNGWTYWYNTNNITVYKSNGQQRIRYELAWYDPTRDSVYLGQYSFNYKTETFDRYFIVGYLAKTGKEWMQSATEAKNDYIVKAKPVSKDPENALRMLYYELQPMLK